MESSENPPKTITRRHFIRDLLRVGAGSALATVIGSKIVDSATAPNLSKKPETSSKIPKPPYSQLTEPTAPNDPKKEIIDPDAEILNKILGAPPHTQSRKALENQFLNSAKTLDQIDKGFWVTSDSEIRYKLLEKRTQLRQEALPKQLINWANQQKIHPEVLGICLDAYRKIQDLKMMGDLQKMGPIPTERASTLTVPNDVPAEELLINPGGMAKLITYETSGFVNIGEGTASQEIRRGNYDDVTPALTELCQFLSNDLGLNFKPENIPGSLRHDSKTNASGGAIGLQFMPDNALLLYKMLRKIGHKFNPFDPVSSVIGAWVFLAMKEEFKSPDGKITTRFNYRKGDKFNEYRVAAIAKWNPDRAQINTILTTANDFYSKLIQTGIFVSRTK